MTGQVELIKEIDMLPPRYIGEVFDFVGYLRHKAQREKVDEVAAYKAMAADTEREQEAQSIVTPSAVKTVNPSRKSISQYFGILSPDTYGDGVAYQRKLRDEWNG